MAETYTAFVDPNYTVSERREIARSIINYIVDRTKDGRGIGNKDFKKKYSNAYIKTSDFKIADKSPTDVNLTLSGDMLSSIEILDVSVVGRIVIGFEIDTEDDKARFVREKGYEFLGLSDSELQDILTEFGEPETETRPSDISENLVEEFVRGIFGR